MIDEYGPNYAQFDLPIIDGLARSAATRSGAAVDEDARGPGQPRCSHPSADGRHCSRQLSQIDVSNARDAVVLPRTTRRSCTLATTSSVERLQSYVDLSPALHERVTNMEYADVRFDNHVYVRPGAAGAKGEAR